MSSEQASHYTVVVGADYSKLGDLALERAFQLVQDRPDAEIHVVNVAHGYGPMVSVELGEGTETFSLDEAAAALKKHVEARIDAWEADHGMLELSHLVTHLRVGSPAHEIAQLATDLEAEEVVVGTHGRRGVSRLLLGSVAEGVVRLAPCSVSVVRPKSAPTEPKIEPACPECVKVRQASGGKELWCAQHLEHHARRHTYHYSSRQWGGASRHSEIP
ncbi:MAG: universal stress protein [Polyangiaceae bacterium]